MVRYLYTIFREENTTEFEKVYDKRISSESSVKVPFMIKPMDQPEKFPMYYIPTQNIVSLISKVYKQDNLFVKLSEELPPIAKRHLMMELLVDELQNTNDLEGVRSTKEEIVRSTKAINLQKKSNERFLSLISAYQKLLSDEVIEINNVAQIRDIYDEITNNEINQEELPDGKFFRTQATYVHKKSGSGKVIHRGVTPESRIIKLMDQMVEFLKSDDVPPFIKIAISHYYFGYIHPFYDGNGRTSRFISSVYIRKECSELTALSLSKGCNTFRHQYLESFEVTSSIGSRGEMNHFIENFLYIVSETQKEILLQLKEKVLLMNLLTKKLIEDENIGNKCKAILSILAQNYYFSFGERGLTVKELSIITEKSEQYLRTSLTELGEKGIVEQRGKRPVIFTISNHYFE